MQIALWSKKRRDSTLQTVNYRVNYRAQYRKASGYDKICNRRICMKLVRLINGNTFSLVYWIYLDL